MPGRALAVTNGDELKQGVIATAAGLGLLAEPEVKVGRRIWGAKRFIDVVLTRRETGLKLGVECKYQSVGGSAEEKIPAILADIRAWPVRGLVVYDGPGFSENMKGYLVSTGRAVEFADLGDWLRLYFSIEREADPVLDLPDPA